MSTEDAMYEIFITEDLAFGLDPRGAVLLFKAIQDGECDVFQIGMTKATLRQCREAIDADEVAWTNNDKSLTITGGKDSITLEFVPECPVWEARRIELSGRTLEFFRNALEFLSMPNGPDCQG